MTFVLGGSILTHIGASQAEYRARFVLRDGVAHVAVVSVIVMRRTTDAPADALTTGTLMTTALDVARFFLDLAGQELDSEGLTASRLHRLLLLAQGWHLAAFDRPLYADSVLRGPAVQSIRDVIGQTGGPDRPLRPGDLGAGGLPFRDRRFTEAIWGKYRGYSAVGLRELFAADPVGLGASEKAREGVSEELSAEQLKKWFVGRPELRHFDPQEWEAVTEGEQSFRDGPGITLSDLMTRLRARCTTNSTSAT